MLKRHLNPIELRRLKMYLNRQSQSPHNDREKAFSLIVDTMLNTGLRTDEMCRLTVSNIDVANRMIHLVDPAKGSNKGSMPISSSITKRLVRATQHLKPCDLITDIAFPGMQFLSRKNYMHYSWARLRFKLFGVGFKLGLHCLRHTFGGGVHAVSGSLKTTQQALRHKNVNSTTRYIPEASEAEMRKIIRKAI